MKPARLVLRCMAEQKKGQWQVLCLDLCLAAQADTFDEAKAKLEHMICDYVYDALAGEDREFAEQLLNRKAPFRDWVKYYGFAALQSLGALRDGVRKLFIENMPIQPTCHA